MKAWREITLPVAGVEHLPRLAAEFPMSEETFDAVLVLLNVMRPGLTWAEPALQVQEHAGAALEGSE